MAAASWSRIVSLLEIVAPGDAFSSNRPLTSRQSSADHLLHSLLLQIDRRLIPASIPSPKDREQLKSYRTQLFKSVEIVIKRERETGRGWMGDVAWRKSSFDTAQGEKFEAVLAFLSGIALRNLVEGRLRSPIADLIPDPQSSDELILATAQKVEDVYKTELDTSRVLAQSQQATIESLRRREQEFASIKMELESASRMEREYDSLDIIHLEALRNRRANELPNGVWSLLLQCHDAIDTSMDDVEETGMSESTQPSPINSDSEFTFDFNPQHNSSTYTIHLPAHPSASPDSLSVRVNDILASLIPKPIPTPPSPVKLAPSLVTMPSRLPLPIQRAVVSINDSPTRIKIAQRQVIRERDTEREAHWSGRATPPKSGGISGEEGAVEAEAEKILGKLFDESRSPGFDFDESYI